MQWYMLRERYMGRNEEREETEYSGLDYICNKPFWLEIALLRFVLLCCHQGHGYHVLPSSLDESGYLVSC